MLRLNLFSIPSFAFVQSREIETILVILIMIVGRAITIRRAIQKRSFESMYNPYQNEEKRLRAASFALAKLQERKLNGEQYKSPRMILYENVYFFKNLNIFYFY